MTKLQRDMNVLLEAKKRKASKSGGPPSPYVINVAKLALKLDRGKLYKHLADYANMAKEEGDTLSLDDLHRVAADLLDTRAYEHALEDKILDHLSREFSKQAGHSPGGGYLHSDSATVRLDISSGTMELSGKFDGAEYDDVDGDIEVPEELQESELRNMLVSLGAKPFIRWTLKNHHAYSDMGQIEYTITASWKFDPTSLMRAVLDEHKLKQLL